MIPYVHCKIYIETRVLKPVSNKEYLLHRAQAFEYSELIFLYLEQKPIAYANEANNVSKDRPMYFLLGDV